MSDLKTQLREYTEANVERIDVDDVAAVIANQSDGARKPVWRLRPVWVFAIALGAVLLIVGSTAALLRGSTSDPVDQPEPPATMALDEDEMVSADPDATEWTAGVLETFNYSCGRDPRTGCGDRTNHRYEGLTLAWQEESPTYERIYFWLQPDTPISPWSWGVRIEQIQTPPSLPGDVDPISGEAWLEVTISNASALPAFDEAQPGFLRESPPGRDELVTEAVLVSTTEDMMQWVIGLAEPGEYLFRTFERSSPGLWIEVLRESPASIVEPDVWNPILTTTQAKQVPTPVACPEGSTPDVPGPVDQPRPAAGPWNNQAAVFDSGTGKIVFVDDRHETWTFDVCSNTWQQMSPEGTPGRGELVYDVDSDRVLAIGPETVSVYDAATNAWTHRSSPANLDLQFGYPGLGAIYDPVSGLVLVLTLDGDLVAYNVDSDEWTAVGKVFPSPGYPPNLVGYSAETDRLYFLPYASAIGPDDGIALDPRTGRASYIEAVGADGAFGLLPYATGGDTAYVRAGGRVCRLDPTGLDWTCVSPHLGAANQAALVMDPLHRRLVVITDFCCNWPGTASIDDVWALDLDTNEWVQILEPTLE